MTKQERFGVVKLTDRSTYALTDPSDWNMLVQAMHAKDVSTVSFKYRSESSDKTRVLTIHSNQIYSLSCDQSLESLEW